MEDHFSETAKEAMIRADRLAKSHRREQVAAIHVLIGVLDDSEGAARAFLDAGIDAASIHAEARKLLAGGSRSSDAEEFEAKAAIAAAFMESRRRRHAAIGTEHILFGLLADESGTLNRILTDLGIPRRRLQRTIDARLAKQPTVDPPDGDTEDGKPLTAGKRRSQAVDVLPRGVLGRMALFLISLCTLFLGAFACYCVTMWWGAQAPPRVNVIKIIASEFSVVLVLTSVMGFIWAVAAPKWLEKFAEQTAKRLNLLFWLLFATSLLALVV